VAGGQSAKLLQVRTYFCVKGKPNLKVENRCNFDATKPAAIQKIV
jgi:hypothetical protein